MLNDFVGQAALNIYIHEDQRIVKNRKIQHVGGYHFKSTLWDFPGGPMVKTSLSYARGVGFLGFLKNLFIYLWLCWVFVSVRGLSLVMASGGHSSSRCTGLSLSRPLLLRSTGSRRASSVIVAHRLSCSAACGIFPDQGSNPCPVHWQADSQPLRHQGSPICLF